MLLPRRSRVDRGQRVPDFATSVRRDGALTQRNVLGPKAPTRSSGCESDAEPKRNLTASGLWQGAVHLLDHSVGVANSWVVAGDDDGLRAVACDSDVDRIAEVATA